MNKRANGGCFAWAIAFSKLGGLPDAATDGSRGLPKGWPWMAYMGHPHPPNNPRGFISGPHSARMPPLPGSSLVNRGLLLHKWLVGNPFAGPASVLQTPLTFPSGSKELNHLLKTKGKIARGSLHGLAWDPLGFSGVITLISIVAQGLEPRMARKSQFSVCLSWVACCFWGAQDSPRR